jgi:hypothetical protein
MNTLKILAFAALLSTLSLVSVAQTPAGIKPAAAHHAIHKAPTSKAKSKHIKPKPKTVTHGAKKPVAKKSSLKHSSLAKKKTGAHKKAVSAKHGITVSR